MGAEVRRTMPRPPGVPRPRPMIIDAHTHCYPREAARDPRAWARERGEAHWADLVAPVDRPSLQDWCDVDEMLRAMDAAGVERAVLLGWYWENEATCRWHNRFMAEWMASAPERFVAFAAIQPASGPDATLAQLREAESLGFQGAGELLGPVQGFRFDDPGFEALARWTAERGWPINCHATETAGLDHPGRVDTPLQDFVELASAHPELKIILAHWGGGLPFFELNPSIRAKLERVYYDTAATPLLYSPDVFRRIIDITGPERVLFGSDFPLRVFPRQEKRASMERFVRQIREQSGLDESEWGRVMGANCAELLPRPPATRA